MGGSRRWCTHTHILLHHIGCTHTSINAQKDPTPQSCSVAPETQLGGCLCRETALPARSAQPRMLACREPLCCSLVICTTEPVGWELGMKYL